MYYGGRYPSHPTLTHLCELVIHTNNRWESQLAFPSLWIPVSEKFTVVLGKGSNNQNGNLRWHLPLGVRPPPPLNGTNFQTFFTPLFFFCNWILHIWNGFYTSKISLLSPLIIGSKLTFISGSGRWLPTIEPCSKSSQLLYIHNIKPKLSAKHVFTVREWF